MIYIIFTLYKRNYFQKVVKLKALTPHFNCLESFKILKNQVATKKLKFWAMFAKIIIVKAWAVGLLPKSTFTITMICTETAVI